MKIRNLGRIGGGGMADVFAVLDDGVLRALKVPHAGASRTILERTIEEARVLAAFGDGRTMPRGRAVDYNGRIAILMDLVHGVSLESAREAIAASPRAVVDVLLQLAQWRVALPASVVHRDLKPDNVLITAAGVVTPVDWGSAFAPRPRAVVTSDVGLGLTEGYHSADAYDAPTAAADVFQIAATVFRIATGRRLARRLPAGAPGSPLEFVIKNVRYAVATPVEREALLAVAGHGDLAPILDRALELDPNARIDATGLLASLAAVQNLRGPTLQEIAARLVPPSQFSVNAPTATAVISSPAPRLRAWVRFVARAAALYLAWVAFHAAASAMTGLTPLQRVTTILPDAPAHTRVDVKLERPPGVRIQAPPGPLSMDEVSIRIGRPVQTGDGRRGLLTVDDAIEACARDSGLLQAGSASNIGAALRIGLVAGAPSLLDASGTPVRGLVRPEARVLATVVCKED